MSSADWYAADKSEHAPTSGDGRDTCHGSGHSRCGSRGSRGAALRSSASHCQRRRERHATPRTSHRPAEIGGSSHHVHPPPKATLPCIRPIVLERASACSAAEKRRRLGVVGVRLRHGGGVSDCAARLVRAGVVRRGVPREPRPLGLGLGFGGHLGRVGGRDVGRRLVCSGACGSERGDERVASACTVESTHLQGEKFMGTACRCALSSLETPSSRSQETRRAPGTGRQYSFCEFYPSLHLPTSLSLRAVNSHPHPTFHSIHNERSSPAADPAQVLFSRP